MAEEHLLYVAGNPDCYPIEYYDDGSESYQGILPELMERFAGEYGYRIAYVDSGGRDERGHLAENLQVDLVSGCMEEEIPKEGKGVLAFEAQMEKGPMRVWIAVTDVAPSGLVEELKSYFGGSQTETVNGLLLAEAQRQAPGTSLRAGALGAGVTMALMTGVLAFVVHRYRSRLKKNQEESEIDPVTGLGNRKYLSRYYRQFIQEKNRILYYGVYFYTDTDRLLKLSGQKETEDFLRHGAVILGEYTGDGDILAQIAEDGYIVMRQAVSVKEAEEWARLVRSRILEEAKEQKAVLEPEISVGIYPLKTEDWDEDRVLLMARQTARLAARRGEDCLVCGQETERELQEEKELKAELERAFSQEEFQMYLHFYVDGRTGQAVGAEALSRWQHPVKGFLPPGQFIGLMEQEDAIGRLDYYCLEKACRFLERIHRAGKKDFFLSTNFSRRTFSADDFPERCQQIIDRYAFPRECLKLELTESIPTQNFRQVQRNMEKMKQYGVKLLLDDFGEDAATFSDLQKYPMDGVKLAKSLVDECCEKKGEAILKAVMEISHTLGLFVIAEGVEEEKQVEVLRKLNCDIIQGYRFYIPVPEWEAEKKLLGIGA